MKVIRASEATTRLLGSEQRRYHLFDVAELITTWIPPHSEQEWHRHSEIYELTFVTEGSIEGAALNFRTSLHPGDAVLFSPDSSFHNLCNVTDQRAVILTFKFKPSEDSCHNLFATDKQQGDEL